MELLLQSQPLLQVCALPDRGETGHVQHVQVEFLQLQARGAMAQELFTQMESRAQHHRGVMGLEQRAVIAHHRPHHLGAMAQELFTQIA